MTTMTTMNQKSDFDPYDPYCDQGDPSAPDDPHARDYYTYVYGPWKPVALVIVLMVIGFVLIAIFGRPW